VMVLAPETGDNQLYAYFVRWAGTEKSQSAWCAWKIEGVGKVLHLRVIDGYLYAVARSLSGAGAELLRFSLNLSAKDGDFAEDYSFLLDRLAVVSPQYNALGNYTDLILPYQVSNLSAFAAIKTDDWQTPGELVDIRTATLVNGGTTVRLQGNLGAGRVAVGMNYTARAELSRPYLRDGQGNAITVGRLQVRDITVAYKDAAWFEVEVATRGRTTDPQTYVAGHNGLFTARTLNDSQFRLGGPQFHSGERRFPVQSRSDQVQITLTNRLPYQCWWLSAQYRALFSSRSAV
jgi:hypothetical protein